MWLLRAFCATALLLLVVGGSPASAQGCGPTNPNCIVPTAPVGTNNNQAASTAFVDAAVAASTSSFYTGLSGDCTATSLGVITCTKTNGVIFYTGLPSPVNPADAATKAYVDSSVSAGLTPHPSVVLGTTTALAANTYNNGTAGVGATLTANSNGTLSIDGSAVTTSQRVLVKNESTAANNGIYVVTQTGGAGTPYILTRATDANTPGTGSPTTIGFGTYVLVTGGTANPGTGWSVSSTVSTIGTSAINWAQFSASGGVLSVGGITGNVLCGIAMDCSSVAQTVSGQGPVYYNVKLYGAKGDCSTDDTTAFQNAWNAASAGGGSGVVYVPPVASGGCYLVSKINGTNAGNVIVSGNGDNSLIKINGSDSDGNFWDLSGSNNISFRDLKLIDNGSAQAIIFFWACTGTSCGTSGVLSGLSFDHVNMTVKHVHAGLFAYGYGCAANCGTNISGASLSISNSTWKNTNNGSSTTENTRNAVLSLSAYNNGSFRSVNQTITTSTAIAARTHLYNVDLIDFATAAGTQSNNAAVVTDGINQMVTIGGSFQCNCVTDFIGWTSDEGLTMSMPVFTNPAFVACGTSYWMEFGGGLNGVINLQSPFWSCPAASGAYIALDQGTGATTGGIEGLTVVSNDPGLNTNSDPFIGKTAAGCGSFTSTNNWITNSSINLIAGANNITTCGGIDAKTIIQNAGTITIQSGGTDHGASNPFR